MELMRSPEAPVGFPFLEKMVRQKIGLPKDEARAWRRAHLSEGDYCIHKKALYLSVAAANKLMEAAGQQLEKSRSAQSGAGEEGVKSEAEKNAEPKEPAEPVTLVVVRANLANRHIMVACEPGDNLRQPKRPLRVRVKETVNFVPGMEIPAVLVDGYADLYDLARALPRKKGKW